MKSPLLARPCTRVSAWVCEHEPRDGDGRAKRREQDEDEARKSGRGEDGRERALMYEVAMPAHMCATGCLFAYLRTRTRTPTDACAYKEGRQKGGTVFSPVKG
jgi:hypothetical protein